jgi:beta-mannosidase
MDFVMTYRTFVVRFALALGWLGLVISSGAQERVRVPIHSGWEFRQSQKVDASGLEKPVVQSAEWRPAQVPGDVHLDLLRNKLIPDPFYRDNESKLQWIENASWEYRTDLSVSPQHARSM